jgi:hypothetical protein
MSSKEKSTAFEEAHWKASLPIAVLVTTVGDEPLVVTDPTSVVPDALALARTLLT